MKVRGRMDGYLADLTYGGRDGTCAQVAGLSRQIQVETNVQTRRKGMETDVSDSHDWQYHPLKAISDSTSKSCPKS